MIKVTISYPRVEGKTFDHDYFFNYHLPLFVDRIRSAAARMTVDIGVTAAPWPGPEFDAVCSFICESRERFEAAFFPHVEELQDDMDRCGSATPVIQVSEVVIDRPCAGELAHRSAAKVVSPMRRAPARAAMATA